MRSDRSRIQTELFNYFLPEINDPRLFTALQFKLNELIIATKATGYTFLPPSRGFWYHNGSVKSEPVHPLQIVSQDTPLSFDEIEQFAQVAAELLRQDWLYGFRVPVRVNEPPSRWS